MKEIFKLEPNKKAKITILDSDLPLRPLLMVHKLPRKKIPCLYPYSSDCPICDFFEKQKKKEGE